MNKFTLKVNTPSGILFEDEVVQVEIKTPSGMIGILSNHTPIIGSFEPSVCYIRDSRNSRISTIINNGLFSFKNNELNLFTDFFTFSSKFHPNIIEERKKIIDQALKQTDISNKNSSYDKIRNQLFEHLNKLTKITKK